MPVSQLKTDQYTCGADGRHTRHTAMETARIAFAPSFDLSLVPSRSIMALSMAAWSVGSLPCKSYNTVRLGFPDWQMIPESLT